MAQLCTKITIKWLKIIELKKKKIQSKSEMDLLNINHF